MVDRKIRDALLEKLLESARKRLVNDEDDEVDEEDLGDAVRSIEMLVHERFGDPSTSTRTKRPWRGCSSVSSVGLWGKTKALTS